MMDWILGEHQLEQSGEKYYSEEYLKTVLEENQPLHTIQLFDFEDEEFTRLLEEIKGVGMQERIDIYIDSNGGSIDVRDKIHFVLSQYSNVNLIACGQLGSAAFTMFVTLKCNKYISDTAMPMYHQYTIGSTKFSNGKADNRSNFVESRRADYLEPEVNKFMEDCGFSKKEKEVVNSGEDLYINPSRVLEMVEQYEKNNKHKEND